MDSDDTRCVICAQPIWPGDKAMFRQLPDKGLVRVHIVCYAKARIQRLNHRTRS